MNEGLEEYLIWSWFPGLNHDTVMSNVAFMEGGRSGIRFDCTYLILIHQSATGMQNIAKASPGEE